MWLWAFSIGGLLLASCSTAKTATPTTTGTDPVTLPRSSTSLSTTTTSTTLPAPTTTVPPGVVGYQVVQASKAFLLTGPNGGSDSLSVPCPGGKKVLGGGATITLTPPLTSSTVWLVPFLDQSAPTTDGSGWAATMGYFQQTGAPVPPTAVLQVTATCAVVQ